MKYERCEPDYTTIYKRAKLDADNAIASLTETSTRPALPLDRLMELEEDFRVFVLRVNLMVQSVANKAMLEQLRKDMYSYMEQVRKA